MKFSIITTTFNSIKTIESCIKSINSQNYSNLDLIWIDNNSSDGTYEHLEKYSSKSTQLIKVKNTSIVEAWNLGLEKSKGDVICFLNSDDQYFSENIIYNVAKLFSNKSINLVYSDIIYISKNQKILRNWVCDKYIDGIKDHNYFEAKIKNGWMPAHPGFFIKKEIINEIGNFNTNYKISFDYDFMIRCLKSKNINAEYLNSKTVKMLAGGNSNKLKNILRKMNEDLEIIKDNEIGNLKTLILKNVTKLPQFLI